MLCASALVSRSRRTSLSPFSRSELFLNMIKKSSCDLKQTLCLHMKSVLKEFKDNFSQAEGKRCKKSLKNLDTGLCYSEKQAAAEVCICSNLRFPCPRSAFYLCIHQAPLLHCKSRGYRNGSSTQATPRTVLCCISAGKCTFSPHK